MKSIKDTASYVFMGTALLAIALCVQAGMIAFDVYEAARAKVVGPRKTVK